MKPVTNNAAFRLVRVCALLASASFASCLYGYDAITNITYGTATDTTDRTAGNIDYLNKSQPVSTMSTATETWKFTGPVAQNVYFRRGSTGDNGATAWYQGTDFNSSGGYQVYGQGDTTPTLSELMLTSNLSEGLRNPFANTVSSSSIGATSNIERIDFYFGSSGYVVTENDALAFFDLENYGNHGDGFRIAAITGWTSGAPTAYANAGLMVTPGSYGDGVPVPGGGNTGYIRSTTTAGDDISSSQSVTSIDTNTSGSLGSSDLVVVGVMIRLSDLGLSVGQTIYGYSLMAGDVVASSGSDLVDYTNTSVYLNTTNAGTDPNADYGNVDFAAFGAQISHPAPEPSAYGVIFMGLCLGGWMFRRKTHAR